MQLLKANAISPAVMARFFVQMRQPVPGAKAASAPERAQLPIALASHPADAERIRFFEEAAR